LAGISPRMEVQELLPYSPLYMKYLLRKFRGSLPLKNTGPNFSKKSENIEFGTIYNKKKYMKMLKVLNPQNKVVRPVKLIITESQFKSLISNINEQPLKYLMK
jgi:hypothetical protein